MNLVWRSIVAGLGLWFRHLVQFVLALLLVSALILGVLGGTDAGRSWVAGQGIWVANQLTAWYIQVSDIRSPGLGEWEFGTLRVYPPDLDQSVFTASGLRVAFPLDQWQNGYRVHRVGADSIELDINRFNAMSSSNNQRTQTVPPSPGQLFGQGVHISEIRIDRLTVANSAEYGTPLQGALAADLHWAADQRLPDSHWNWNTVDGDELLVLTTDNRDGAWAVTAHSVVPADTWLHRTTQWPLDEALAGEFHATINPSPLAVNLQKLSVPWLSHRVALSGLVRQRPDGWSLQGAELLVDERLSTLDGRWSGGRGSVDGTLDLPLTVLKPWLPEGFRAHGLSTDDHLTADINWSSDAPWQLSADLATHWYGQTARIDLQAGGNRYAMDDFHAEASVGASELTLSGVWHLSTHRGALQADGQVDRSLIQPVSAMNVAADWVETTTLSGTLIGNGRSADGSIAWPDWRGTLGASGAIPDDYGIPADRVWTMSTSTTWQHPKVTWRDLTLTIGDRNGNETRMGSSGQFHLNEQRIAASWTLLPGNLLPWLESLTDLPPGLDSARLAASGRVDGPAAKPDLSARVRARGAYHAEPWQLELELPQLGSDRVLIDRLHGTWRDSAVTASGSLQPELGADWQSWQTRLDISPISLSLANLSDVVPDWPESLDKGSLMSSVSVRGALGDPEMLAQARLNATYRNEPLTGSVNWQADDLQADFNWQDRYARIDGTGRPWTNGNWQVLFERLQTADLSPWVSLPDNLLSAQLTHSGSIGVQGNLKNLSATLQSEHVGRWRGQAVAAQLDGEAEVSDGALQSWQLADSTLNWGDAMVTLSAASTGAQLLPETGRAELSALPLHDLLERDDLDADLSGQVTYSADWPKWDIAPELSLTGSVADEPLRADLVARIEGIGQQIRRVALDTLSVDIADSAQVRGRGGLTEAVWDLTLNWDGLDWRPPGQWPTPDSAWAGDGRLRLTGRGNDPDIRGTMNWATEWPDRGDDSPVPIDLNIQAGTTVDTFSLTSSLEMSGRQIALAGLELPRQPWPDRLEQPWQEWVFDGFWEISAPMASLGFWLGQEALQLQGNLSGDGVASGSVGGPALDGTIDWSDGTLRLAATNTELYDITASLSADSAEQVDLDASARAGDGTLALQGALSRTGAQWTPDLTLSLDDAAVIQRPDVQSLANGQLALSGTLSKLDLAGTVGLRELSVNLNRLSNDTIPQLRVSNDETLNGGGGSLPLTLDVTLDTDGPASIRGNGLDALLSGELRLTGTPDNISSDGALNIDSGSFNLLTRRFDLQEGEMRLVDEALTIDIRALHQRGNTTIEARLSGNTDELRLQLQSTPALPEDEIIAQLLFGKTVQNMSPWQALQLANAVNQLRGGQSIDLLMATRDTLGLDTLEVDSGEDGENTSLRVGRYLNSRVYLEVDTELAAEQDWQSTVEVELTPNLNLETSTGSGGRGGGLQLRWRRDY